jgi:hypothetical protein
MGLGLLAAAAVVFAANSRQSAQAQSPTVPGLAGAWTWTWKDHNGQTHRHVLQVEGLDTKLAARETFDDEPPVRAETLKFKDKTLRFTVTRGPRRAEYTGKLSDPDHLNGTVVVTTGEGQATEHVWKAERRKDLPK